MSILPPKALDRRLVRAAVGFNVTPQDLSEAVLGQLSPAEAEDRLHRLLNEVTILDEVEQRRLLLIDMADHLAWMKTKRDDPKMITALNQAFTMVSKQLDKANVNVADISTKLATDHAQYMVDAFMSGFSQILRVIESRGDIIIEEGDVKELIQIGIKSSQEQIAKVTAGE